MKDVDSSQVSLRDVLHVRNTDSSGPIIVFQIYLFDFNFKEMMQEILNPVLKLCLHSDHHVRVAAYSLIHVINTQVNIFNLFHFIFQGNDFAISFDTYLYCGYD